MCCRPQFILESGGINKDGEMNTSSALFLVNLQAMYKLLAQYEISSERNKASDSISYLMFSHHLNTRLYSSAFAKYSFVLYITQQ
jgi:hypothetical protein